LASRVLSRRSVKEGKGELGHKVVWLLNTSLFKVSFCLPNDQAPLCFLVLERLFQDVDSEKSQVNGLSLGRVLDWI